MGSVCCLAAFLAASGGLSAAGDAAACKAELEIERRLVRGATLTEVGQLEQAEAVFRELAEERPDSPQALNNLAVVQALRGAYPEAVANWRLSISRHAGFEAARANLDELVDYLAARAAAGRAGKPPPDDELVLRLVDSTCSTSPAPS